MAVRRSASGRQRPLVQAAKASSAGVVLAQHRPEPAGDQLLVQVASCWATARTARLRPRRRSARGGALCQQPGNRRQPAPSDVAGGPALAAVIGAVRWSGTTGERLRARPRCLVRSLATAGCPLNSSHRHKGREPGPRPDPLPHRTRRRHPHDLANPDRAALQPLPDDRNGAGRPRSPRSPPRRRPGPPRTRNAQPCRPTPVMSFRALTRHTYDGTQRGGRMP